MKTETSITSREILDELYWHDWNNVDVFCPFDDNSSPFVRVFRKYFKELGLASLMWSDHDEPSLKVTNDGVNIREIARLHSGFWSADTRYMLRYFKNLVTVSKAPGWISKRVLDTLIQSGSKFLIAGELSDVIPSLDYPHSFPAYCQNKLSAGYTSEDTDPRKVQYMWWTNLPHEDPEPKPASSWVGTAMTSIDAKFSEIDSSTGAGVFLTFTGADRSGMELVEVPLCEIARVNRKRYTVWGFREYVKTANCFGYNYLLLRKNR